MIGKTTTPSDSDNGFLLRIAGMAVTLASVVALSLPLVMGAAPTAPADNNQALADLAATFNRPIATQVVQQSSTLGQITLKHDGPVIDKFFNEHGAPSQASTIGDYIATAARRGAIIATTGTVMALAISAGIRNQNNGQNSNDMMDVTTNALNSSRVWGRPFPHLQITR